MKVGFLTIAPSPYIQEMFRVLKEDGRLEPHVFYQETHSPAFDWRIEELPDYWEQLPSRTVNFLGARLFVGQDVIATVSKHHFDAFVVGGYASLTSHLLVRWLRRNRIPWAFWGEIPGYQRRGFFGQTLRQLAMRHIVSGCPGIAAVGSKAKEYYTRAAGENCVVSSIPYYTDVSEFSRICHRRSHTKGDAVKLLFCGQLVERKGIHLLVQAVLHLLQQDQVNVSLDLVGRGELHHELERTIPVPFRDRFRFHGFRQPAELPAYFSNADVFILPSLHDGWGVVINQAMASGLPVISTTAVGAAVDLVKNGVNGCLISPGDFNELVQAIRNVCCDESLRTVWGNASAATMSAWTPNVEADRWYDLISRVTGDQTL